MEGKLSYREALRTRRYLQRTAADNPETPPKYRRFYLLRQEDESGVSGTGVVAVGVEFPSGQCVIEWVTKRTEGGSLGVYDSMAALEQVHGHGGKTEVCWQDADSPK